MEDISIEFRAKLKSIMASNLSEELQEEFIDTLLDSVKYATVEVYRVQFYDGDIQNGGDCYYWTYEEAEEGIDEAKKVLNGWTSRISEPELVFLDDADIDVLLEALREEVALEK